MIIQIIRLSSSALPPPLGATVVVVVAWAPSRPFPGTSRLVTVVNVRRAGTAATGAASPSSSSASSTFWVVVGARR
jgi:hypothetical protein